MTLNKSLALGFVLGTIALNCAAHNDELVLQETKTLALDTADISHLAIEAGAGSLKVVGGHGDSIEVTAEIYQIKPHSDYCLTLTNTARGGLLKAGNCDDRRHYGRDMQTSINLTVHLPKEMTLNIADGSGSIDVSDVAKTEIHDGSGSIKVRDITGNLVIHDGSGSIQVSNVAGSVRVHDGSGPIVIKNVEDDVEVTDGSSSIEIANVSGGVSVSDGSGGINVDGAKSFKLISDGSGQVNVTNVSGQVSM